MKKFYSEIDANAHIANFSADVSVNRGCADVLILFDNLYDGVITAVKFIASGYNSFGDLIPVNGQERFFIVIQDLCIRQGMSVRGLRYRLMNSEIRRVDLEEYQICFDDGRILSYPGRDIVVIDTAEYEENSEDAETLAAMRTYVTPSFRYFPQEYDSGWFCACGYFNRSNAGQCLCCGSERDAVLSVRNEETFLNILGQYRQVQGERERQMQEAQEQAAAYASAMYAEREAAKQYKRERRYQLRPMLALLLSFIAAFIFMTVLSIEKTEVTYYLRTRTETVSRLDGRVIRETIYERGRVVSESEFDSLGKKSHGKTYEYYDLYTFGSKISIHEINAPSSYSRDEFNCVYDASGNIEKVNTVRYDASGVIGFGTAVFEYDDQGNAVKTVYYENGMIPDRTVLFEHDDRGNETKITYTSGDGTILFYYENEYDEDGNVTSFLYADQENDYRYRYCYEYDDNGNRVKSYSINLNTDDGEEGQMSGYTLYQYDSRGNNTGYSSYDAEDNLQYAYRYEYDDEGRMRKETYCSSNGNPSSCCELDEDGKEVKHTAYDRDGNIKTVTLFQYNADGNVVKATVYDGQNRLKETTVFEYDKSAILVKETVRDANGKVIKTSRYRDTGSGATRDEY